VRQSSSEGYASTIANAVGLRREHDETSVVVERQAYCASANVTKSIRWDIQFRNPKCTVLHKYVR
jgi:hypothetical protein